MVGKRMLKASVKKNGLRLEPMSRLRNVAIFGICSITPRISTRKSNADSMVESNLSQTK